MKTDKQLRVLELRDRYKVASGRVWCKTKGEWTLKVASVVDGYRQHILFGGRG